LSRIFELKALGVATIKGVETPLPVYEVLGAGRLRTRLQVAERRGLTRFVDATARWNNCKPPWSKPKPDMGRLSGRWRAGVGEVAVVLRIQTALQSGCLMLEAYSVAHGKATAYLPVIELLKSYFQIQPQDDERTRREKIGGKVLMLDRSLEDTLPYLFSLLGIDDPSLSLQQMDPQIRRRRTFEALKKLFLRESLNQPLILVFEDLHWIDGETQGFLDALSESVVSAKILLLVNYRPEYRHEWGQKSYYTQLRLAPFARRRRRSFLDVLLGDDSSPHPLLSEERENPSPHWGEGYGEGHGRQSLHSQTAHSGEDRMQSFFMEEIVQELF